jgi:methionine-rich copper-binding protein CopC
LTAGAQPLETPRSPITPTQEVEMVRIVVAILSAWFALSPPLADPAQAHSRLAASTPAEGAVLRDPPAEAAITFDEAARLTALRLIGPDGERIALPGDPMTSPGEARAPLPPLAPGAYEIEWRALSVDGHPIRGRIRFTVEDAR